MTEEKKYPSLVAGAFILNKKGEIFLVRAPHWSNKLVIPGGHVEYGEKIEDAVVREVKEETNLDITGIEFLKIEEILDPEFYTKKKHLVSITFLARVKEGSPEVILDEKEGSEYFWLSPKEAVKHEDIEEFTKFIIEEFFIKKSKKLFEKKNKNCEKCDEYKAGWSRAQADYQNLVKETEKKRFEWAEYSERQILEEFIPVYDNFKQAFTAYDTDDADIYADDADNADLKKWKNWKKGIGYIMKQFGDILKQHGVEEIDTVGQEFSPELHEALSEEPASAQGSSVAREVKSGCILRQVSAGYKMKGKVIKVAKVVVAK